MTSTGFLATVKEMSVLEESPVHLLPQLDSGVEVGASLRLAPKRGSGLRRGIGRES